MATEPYTLDSAVKLIREIVGVNDPIDATTRLRDDLGVDELDRVELAIAIEESLNLEFSSDEWIDEVQTVGQFVHAINAQISKEAAPSVDPTA